MSAKRAFFSVFQKFMVICCTVFFGFSNAFSTTLPAGYQQVEYIESNGTQWIDTGYIPSITDTLTTVIKSPSTLPTSGVYYLYGTRDAYLVNGFVIQLYKNFYLQYGEKDTGNLGALVAGTDYTIVQKGPTYSVNGDSVTVSGASTPVLTRPLYLFTANNGGEVHASKSSFRLYSFTAKSSDSSYKMNLVPAKNSSGVVGMYDTVGNRFYTNAGTGEFTAGPVVLDQCRNLLNPATVVPGYVYTDGEIRVDDQYKCSDYIRVYKDQTYVKSNIGAQSIAFYDINKTFQQRKSVTTFTASYDGYVRINMNANDTNMQFEQGSTATAYVPFCSNLIKIATTAYNTAQFSPVMTDLNSTIATIRDVVTNTINQTKAIADLQAKKQTRPDEQCPAGKKCLLVEDNDGVPHWYEIIEAPED